MTRREIEGSNDGTGRKRTVGVDEILDRRE
jgi:hypothetical protein